MYRMFKAEDYTDIGVIERIAELEVSPNKKEKLLKECISYFTDSSGCPPLNEFIFEGEEDAELEEDEWLICCCSQLIKHPYYIKHMPTGKRFRVGNTCFSNLFGDAINETLFFKPLCKNECGEKVANKRSNFGKEGFCSKKCLNIWNKKCYCNLCGKKFWRINPLHKMCKKCYFGSFYGVAGKADYNLR